jgi:hypothetical protein
MDAPLLVQVYGWAAYLSAAATALTFATGILFFTVGGPFGKINDIFSVLQVLFMVPLAILFVQVLAPDKPVLAIMAAAVGIVGMLAVAYGQSLLVLGRIDFEGSLRYFPAGGAIGLWLAAVSLMAAQAGEMPELLVWLGVLAGAGYLATVIGFLMGGQEHPVFYIGGVVLGVGYPIWAIWLGRLIFAGAFDVGIVG